MLHVHMLGSQTNRLCMGKLGGWGGSRVSELPSYHAWHVWRQSVCSSMQGWHHAGLSFSAERMAPKRPEGAGPLICLLGRIVKRAWDGFVASKLLNWKLQCFAEVQGASPDLAACVGSHCCLPACWHQGEKAAPQSNPWPLVSDWCEERYGKAVHTARNNPEWQECGQDGFS